MRSSRLCRLKVTSFMGESASPRNGRVARAIANSIVETEVLLAKETPSGAEVKWQALVQTEREIPGSFRNPPESNCRSRSEEHTSELQSRFDLVCRLLL